MSKEQPFKFLGYDKTGYFYSSNNRAICLETKNHIQSELISLAPLEYWLENFPRGGKSETVDWTMAVDFLFREQEEVGKYKGELSKEETEALLFKNPILRFFKYEHLPDHLQEVSKYIYLVANQMDSNIPDGPEKSAGLRKLLEAKDCFVRANL